MKKALRFIASLKLAVIVLLALTLSLAAATFIESLYDTPTAQYWVYKSWWFMGILGLLGVNILAVMIDRIPWKPRHTPFLLAHIGILTLLFGSWLTQRIGLDGNMRISEGETSAAVELDHSELFVQDSMTGSRLPMPWIPPEVKFKKFNLKDRGLPYDVTVDQYLTHADPIYNFTPDTSGSPLARPALQVKLQGGPMRIQQEFWLWGGDPSWSNIQAGPASLILSNDGKAQAPKGSPSLIITPNANGSFRYLATSSEGRKVTGTLSADKASGYTLEPGWRGDVKIIFEKYVARGMPQTTFVPSHMQHGQMAPPSALHLVAGKGGEGRQLWLGMGERAVLDVDGKQVQLGYSPERVVLPFQVRLDHFQIDHYDGTRDPSSYSSRVTYIDDMGERHTTISMNEPLHFRGITLYQASYEDGMPRPITSIFSVNRDPGRPWKYLGSLLIVLGSILLFAMKYVQKKTAPKKSTQAADAKAPAATGVKV